MSIVSLKVQQQACSAALYSMVVSDNHVRGTRDTADHQARVTAVGSARY